MTADNCGAIRVSYSILSAWESGDIDRAIAPFAGVEIEPTEAMDEGRRKHNVWEREVRHTRRLPRCFGGRKLSGEFETEYKKPRRLNDWCTIVGVLDLIDGTTGVDYKTGKRPATEYANSMQHKVYQVLRPDLKRFEYYCRNQHAHKSEQITMAIVHLTRQTLEDGLNWILTNAAELREHLINHGYGDRLDQGKGV
jgi:hypothetical protein